MVWWNDHNSKTAQNSLFCCHSQSNHFRVCFQSLHSSHSLEGIQKLQGVWIDGHVNAGGIGMFERFCSMRTVFLEVWYGNCKWHIGDGPYGSDGYKWCFDLCIDHCVGSECRKVFGTQSEEKNLNYDRINLPRINSFCQHESGSHWASKSST